MPSLVTGDLFEAVFSYTSDTDPGSTYINRCHFEVIDAGAGGAVDEGDLAGGLSSKWGTQVPACLSTHITYRGCTIQSWTTGVRSAGSISTFGSATGVRAGEQAPPSVAIVVRKRTPSAGRKYRGRLYLPGQSADDVVAGKVLPAYLAVLNGSGFVASMGSSYDLAAPADGVRVRMIVAQEQGAAVPVKRGFVTSANVDPITRTQRRRQVGKGS